jgi:hypothetical protein
MTQMTQLEFMRKGLTDRYSEIHENRKKYNKGTVQHNLMTQKLYAIDKQLLELDK